MLEGILRALQPGKNRNTPYSQLGHVRLSAHHGSLRVAGVLDIWRQADRLGETKPEMPQAVNKGEAGTKAQMRWWPNRVQ